MLVTGSLVGYAYAMEFFIAWYGANEYEWFLLTDMYLPECHSKKL
jgi:molybdopterin-containing oxidoreductase family membrane subunit